MNYIEDSKIKEIDVLFNKFDYIHHQIAVRQGLSDTTFKILRTILILGEGCTQTNIYKSICINKQTVNTSINNLVKNDVIYFESGKGRNNNIYLTNKGKEIIKNKILPIEKIENEILEEMTEKDLQEFSRIANKYLNLLSQKTNISLEKKEEN